MNRSTGGFDRPIAKSRWQDEEEDIGGTYQNQDEGEDNDQAVDQAGYGSRKAKRRCAEHALASFHTGTQGIGDKAAAVGGYATAADRALAEIEEFERLQAELNGDGRSEDREEAAFMNPSPDVSSPEEDMHIRREGNSPHQKAGLVTTEEMRTEGTTAIGPQPASYAESSPGTAWYPEVANSPTSDLILDKEGNQKEENSSGLEKSEDHVRDNQQGELVELNELPATGEATSHRHHISMLNECRSVDIYEKLNRISEGTYGVVYRARDRQTGKICALKRIKLDKERDGFPLTSIREINILLSLSHPSIVNVSEVVVGSSLDSIFMVMEYADHDLKSVMDQRMRQPFSIAEVKCLMLQLLSGIAYLHANWVIHRDLKTSNILYTNRGELKICDFGLARQYGEPLKPYTHLVVTLWYRAPELLLGARTYSTAVDVWSCGCIMAELLAKSPLFQGANELSQLDLIFKNLGYPTNETWPGVDALPNYKKFKFKASGNGLLRSKFPPPGPVFDGRPTISAIGFDLLTGLLDLCPEKRLSAAQAMDHAWFREHPLPKDPSMMPTFPGTNE